MSERAFSERETININGQNIEYTAGINCASNANTKVSHTIFDDDEFEDYGITSNAEYKLFNVFSETNVNGKYFIDYENGKLYIYNDVMKKQKCLKNHFI